VTSSETSAGTAVSGEYCDHCGKPVATGVHERCVRLRTMEPPRYCAQCRRRMVVQVVPRGWVARCVEHGETSSETG
jgi:hypothetical protein